MISPTSSGGVELQPAGPHADRARRTLLAETPAWLSSATAAAAYDDLKGKTAFSAREEMVAKLRESGDLDGEPTPTQRMANFYEKGDKPLEIVATRQWYLTNGGRDVGLRERMLERGAALEWIPAHMKHRFDNWVGGLNGDWLISRQRFFGIPFPVWYSLDADSEPDYEHPLLPSEDELPVDPSTRAPSGYSEDQRGKAGGFVGDPDVMDTWATSSLTPQIAGGWEEDPDLFERVFPMDLCTNAHDIIRTWLFSRIVRAHLENDATPWSHAMISGFIMDPDRKKMSKSKGNAIVPTDVLESYGADAVRWRAAMARPGPGLPVRRDPDEGRSPARDEGPERLQVRARQRPGEPSGAGPRHRARRPGTARQAGPCAGRDNASVRQLRLHHCAGADREVLLGLLRRLCRAGQGAGVRRRGRCGNRVRQGNAGHRAARGAAHVRALPPLLHRRGVVVVAAGLDPPGGVADRGRPGRSATADPAVLDAVAAVLAGVRGAKSTAKVGMRTPVERATVTGPVSALDAIRGAEDDLRAVGSITGDFDLIAAEDTEIRVDAVLGEPPPKR